MNYGCMKQSKFPFFFFKSNHNVTLDQDKKYI